MPLLLLWGANLLSAAPPPAQTTSSGIGLVRHAFDLTGSNRIEGSVQILSAEALNLSGNAVITGDLLVPGTPTVRFSAHPSYGGTLLGNGNAQPSNYVIGGIGSFSLRHVILRTNPKALTAVPAPPQPLGTRDVTLSLPEESAGNFATIRNLTVGGKAGNVVLPSGSYGAVAVSGRNSLTLGVPGAQRPAIYNFQRLTFSGEDDVRIVGPVRITVNSGITVGGRIGSAANPGWLKLRLAAGDLVQRGNNTIYGEVNVPNGTVHFNGNSELVGTLQCDRLVLIGNNLLRLVVLNAPPEVADRDLTTDEDTATPLALSGSDADNDALTYSIISSPEHGELTGTLPNLTYTPARDYYGPDSFTFKATDAQTDSNVATVNITVKPVNDAPVADAQKITTEEDVPREFVLAGRDVENDALTYHIAAQPSKGRLSGIPPSLTYTPDADYYGPDALTYFVNDGRADSEAVQISIDVGPINDPPEGRNQSVITPEDIEAGIVLTGRDRDGDALTYRVVAEPQHGRLEGTAPNLVYKPARDYVGADSFTFRANDSKEDSAIATVAITVTPVNDAPEAHGDKFTTKEDTALPLALTGKDIDGDALTFTVLLPPSHGSLSGTPPNVIYTPVPDYNGPDSFTFKTNDGEFDSAAATIGIDVTPEPDVPVATPQTLETPEDTELPLVLSGVDADGDVLTFTTDAPQHGTLAGTPPSLTYKPAPDFHRDDWFTFTVIDPSGATATARVTITVTPVNDPPRVDASAPPKVTAPEVIGVQAAVTDDGDAPGTELRLKWTKVSGQGDVFFTDDAQVDTSVTYTKGGKYVLRATVTDGQLSASDDVEVTVVMPNQPPDVNAGPEQTIQLAGTANLVGTVQDDGLPEGASLTQRWSKVSGPGSVTFASDTARSTTANFSAPGDYVLRLRASDSVLFGQGQTTVHVLAPNQPPQVNAGPAQELSLGSSSAQLAGNVVDDGLPRGLGLQTQWSVVSGPGQVAFADIYATRTGATFTEAGTYVLRLSATDGELSASAQTQVIVPVVPNAPPVVNAGPDQSLDRVGSTVLHGVITDDGLPAGPTAMTRQWSKVSGPGEVSFTSPHSIGTNVSFSAPGVYVLRLTGSDSALSASDDVTIEARFENQPPFVAAGADQTITLPAGATLAGTVSDDGLPAGTLSIAWAQVSGPGSATFESSASARTAVTFSAPGDYVLRLTADDSAKTAADEVTIKVLASPYQVRTFTLNADFDAGQSANVAHSVADQLELSDKAQPFSFIWVANSTKGTIVKISTETGQVLGEYWSSPNGQPRNPSRTTVDLNGNVWASNRDGNSVLHIGLAEAGQWIDKNGNGKLDTSTGLGDIRPWTNANNADTAGGVSTAEDEAVLHYTRVNSSGTRHVSVDGNNDVWVSGTGGRRYDLIDGKTGLIKRAELSVGYGGYGGLIDKNGIIWSARPFLRWDTSKPLTGPSGQNWTGGGHDSYGMAVDAEGNVWETALERNQIRKWAPNGTLVGTYAHGFYWGQGCAADKSGNVWVAHSINGGSTVGRLKTDGTYIGNITVGTGPTGVAVDAKGKVWVTKFDGTCSRIDPDAGPIGADGVTRVGAVDLTTVNLGGQLYNYSDMTGSTLTGKPLSGTWTAVHDSGKAGTLWGTSNWNAYLCSDSALTVSAATSEDGQTFSSLQTITAGAPLSLPAGRYIKLHVLFKRASSGESPVLYDLTVGTAGYTPQLPANTPPVVWAGEDHDVAWTSPANLNGTICDDGLPHSGARTVQWSKVSGPGSVTFADARAQKTTARFSEPGVYILRFDGSDSVLSEFATLRITANPVNVAPAVSAGLDQSASSSSDTVALHGWAGDDGLPGTTPLAAQWSVVHNPGAVTFAAANSADTTATFAAAGIYVLKLTATDGALSTSDLVEVRIGQPCAIEPASGVVGWWPGNGNAQDLISGREGIPVGGLSYGAGAVSLGFAFDGSNDFLQVPASSALNVGVNEGFTVEFWINPVNRARWQPVIEWNNGSGGGYGAHIWIEGDYQDGRILVNLVDTNGGHHVYRSKPQLLQNNEWQHLTFTYNKKNGLLRVYRNGQFFEQVGLGAFTPQTSYDLYLGRRPGEASHFGGLLDEVTIYNRVLETEIYSLATTGAAGKCPPGANEAPFVDAGVDQSSQQVSAPVALHGLVSDDNLPAGAAIRSLWTLVNGPGAVTFADATQAATTAVFTEPGIYLLRLSAHDSMATASDLLQVNVAVPCSVETPSGVAGWWPANGTFTDLVANRESQQLNGVAFAPAEVSLGFSFDGVNDGVRTAAAAALDIGASDAMTMEFWINPNDRTRWQPIMSWHTGSADGAHVWIEGDYQDGRLWINLIDTNGGHHGFRSRPDMVRTGEWQHIAVTYDKISGFLRLWRNGARFEQVFFGRFTPRTSYDLYFGYNPNDTRFFNGRLDEVTLYRRALDTELNAIYQAGRTGKCALDTNQAPTVSAGPDRSLGQSGTIGLSGTAADDGLPLGSALGVRWSVVDGPGAVSFSDASSLATEATFAAPGTYVLQLAADDSARLATDQVEVRVGQACSVEAAPGLVGWWTANGHTRDLVAQNDGEFLSGTTYAPGKVSLGWKFDGSNDAVRVPAAPELNIGSGDALTIEFWMNPENRSRWQPIVQWHDGHTDGAHIWIEGDYQDGRLWINFIDTAGGHHGYRSSPELVQINQWQHIAVTYDKTTGLLRLWRNGAKFEEVYIGKFSPRTDYNLYFGHRPSDNACFAGGLDEISFYNRVLTYELTEIYSAGAIGKCPPSANRAPFVDAGADVSVAAAGTAVPLVGYVADDGLPLLAPLRVKWTLLQGPGTATFADANSAATSATFSAPGLYVLQLAADDTSEAATDTVEVRVGQSCEAPAAGIVGWWPANGDGRDAIHGFDAQLVSGTTYAAGKVAQGFKFDGANDLVRVPSAPQLNVGAGSGFTVEFWVNPDNRARWQPLVDWNNGSALGAHIWIEGDYQDGRILVNLIDTNGGHHGFRSNPNLLFNGQWQHVAVSYEKATGLLRLYRNGQLFQQVGLGQFTPQTSYDLYFGHRPGDRAHFGGLLDEMSLYSRVLSATEVAAVAQLGDAGKCAPPSNDPPYVDAGLPQQVALGTAVSLSGVLHDDGRPSGSLSGAWTQVSGPAGAVFADANAAATSVTLPAIGTYVLRLTAHDSALSASDDVTIVVTSGATNLPPSVNAGPPQTIRLPATATLNGVATDDGIPAALVTRWRAVSGPGAVTFANPNAAATSVSFTAAGSYLLRLTADDSEFKAASDVLITVHPASPENRPPSVNAGPDQPVYINAPASVHGAVTDDGLPPASAITVSWSKVSGPGVVSFASANALSSAVEFSLPGRYVLRLTASDSDASAQDEVTFDIYPALNSAPVVNAGADQQVSITDGAALVGSVTDDGLPAGSTPALRWSKVSGPGVVTFSSGSAAATHAQFSVRGSYVLALTADDSEKRTIDEVSVVVGSPHNQPPTVNAGVDRSVAFGQSVSLPAQADDDGLPNGGIMISWTVVSGPVAPQFGGTPDALTASFSRVGPYVLRFSADDGEFSASDDVAITVTPASTQAPVVAVTTPLQGAVFNTSATVPLAASATDPDAGGGIDRISFYVDGQLLGTVPAEADGSARLNWLASSIGTHVVTAAAADFSGTTATSAPVNVTVQPAQPTVALTYPAAFSAFAPNASVQLQATASPASGGAAITTVEFLVNGSTVGADATAPYAATWTAAANAGDYTLAARATDAAGQTVTSAPVIVRVSADPSAPLVVELDPAQANLIATAPTTLLGVAKGPTLASWKLDYRRSGVECAEWVTLATGTQNIEGALATLDTTLLLNGTYELRLSAFKSTGGGVAVDSRFLVDGNMKVGQFTATFKDLELPLSGVPITVTRTYDSRNKCPGDFGYGWTLDVDSIRLESTERMGNAWDLFVYVGNPFDPSYYRLDDVGPHAVTVKMPDGELLRFRPKIVMDRPYNRLASLLDEDGDDIGQVFAPVTYSQPVKLIYRERAGTAGAVLKARGYRTTNEVGGLATVAGDARFYLSEVTEGAFSLATRENSAQDAPTMTDVTGWELTLKDGRVLLFDAGGKLEEMRDPVGNKVAFNRTGGKIQNITHSPSGKQIAFERDAFGRIERITDPRLNSAEYRYTANGDLEFFYERGNDPASLQPTTRFTYKGVTHLLEDVLDARGVRAARNYYDDAGRLERTVDAEGKETVFTHDITGRTETIKDRAGNLTVHKYDVRGNVVETRAADGTVTTTGYHRWSDGTLSKLKNVETVTGLFTNENDPAGSLESKTLTTTYSYEDDDPATPAANDGLLRKLVDPKGNTTSFTYDVRGNVLTVTDANANAAGGTPASSVINTYHANGLLWTATDALGNVTTYTYDSRGNPDIETRTVTLINDDGSTTRANVLTDRDYNTFGQLEKLTDALNNVTTFEYDGNGNQRFERTSRTTFAGAVVPVVTETEYDEQDRPVRVWNAENPRAQASRPSSETVYDGNGKVEWTYDALGRGTHHEYNSRGLLWKTTHRDSRFDTVTYDAAGRREIATDRRGNATKTVYDAVGRVKETVYLGDGTAAAVTLSSKRYDAAGRLWQSTDANGNTTTNGYDDSGRRTIVVSPTVALSTGGTFTPTTRYGYDANGNQRFVTDPKGNVTEHLYDALNRRYKTILPAAALDLNGDGLLGTSEQNVVSTVQTGYDELGRKISETDASHRTRRYGYDVLGRLRHVLDFAGQATRYEYDELGNQTAQIDANNHITRYSYDNVGRRLTRTLPLGQQEALDYDEIGNLESRRDFNGRTTTFLYDPLNRLRFRIPDAFFGEPTVEFTYNANGQRETMNDATGTTVYGYDGRGQLYAKQTPFGTLNYTYHANGSLKQVWSSNANGTNVTYKYDPLNRLETVTDANVGTTAYAYDKNSNVESVAYPNGVSHAYSYNALNRLDVLNIVRGSAALASYGYAATPAGQRTSVAEASGRTSTYGYDALGRLQRETITASGDGKNGVASYGYDNVGNRLSRTSSIAGITSQSFTYDWNDRLNGDTSDNNGNTTLAQASELASFPGNPLVTGTDAYDSENRLTKRTGANGSHVTLVYDGDGNRVQEILNGRVTSYLVDDRNLTGYAQVVEEIVNGVVNHTYTFGHDLISQDQVDPVRNTWRASFYGYDGRGSVRFLSDETGAVTDSYTYDAFGTLISATGSTTNRYLFNGERFDSNLGLYYLRARLMNPLTGRFWTMDSYEGEGSDPISLHKYLHAYSDPVNIADYDGHRGEGIAAMALKVYLIAILVANNPRLLNLVREGAEFFYEGPPMSPFPSAGKAAQGTASALLKNVRYWLDYINSSAVKRASQILGRNLENAGMSRGANEAAHHIVMVTHEGAQPARQVLAKFKIDINDAENGVFLRQGFHNGVHTGKYIEEVNARLKDAQSREEALEILKSIRNELLDGG